MPAALQGLGITPVVTGDITLTQDPSLNPFGEHLDSKKILLGVPLRQEVYVSGANLPIVGSRAVEMAETSHNIEGFIYDRRRWVDDDLANSRNPGSAGNLMKRALDGTLDKHWLSGIGSDRDCEFLGLWNQSRCTWLPRLLHGTYFRHWNDHYLWSEEAVTHPLSQDPAADFAFTGFPGVGGALVLQYQPKADVPLWATVYRRGLNLEPVPYLRFSRVEQLTGVPSTDSEDSIQPRQDPYDTDAADGINDPQVETFWNHEILYNSTTRQLTFTSKPWFTIGEPRFWDLSNNQTYPTGDTTALLNHRYFTEQLGTSDGLNNQVYWTKFFPVSPQTQRAPLSVFARNLALVDQWTLATDNNLANHDSTENVFEVDWDYGLIKMGLIAEAAETSLVADLAAGELLILSVDDATGFPARGRLLIGAEVIQYDTRDDVSFYGLTRTTGVAHTAGVTVLASRSGNVPTSGDWIGATYVAVPRIEYEPDQWKDYVTADRTNVHPVLNPQSNGIVWIGRTPQEVVDLELTIDLPSLGGGVYGPLNSGLSDYALLTATATGYGGEPIPGVSITIDELVSPFVGLLAGSPSAYTSLSNQDGELNVPWFMGGSLSYLGAFSTQWSTAVGKTFLTIDQEIHDPDLSRVLLYAVTKDDPHQGTVGVWVDALGYVDSSPFGSAQSRITLLEIILDGSAPATVSSMLLGTKYPDGVFDGAPIDIWDTSGVKHSATVLYWRSGIAHLDQDLPISGSVDYALIRAANWLAWDETELNGMKKVIYTYSSSSVHPVTGALGAYYPVLAVNSVVGGGQTTFEFPNTLPEPFPSDDTQNLGAYWLSVDATIPFRAHTDTLISNRRIYSNTVKIRVGIPDYLLGVSLGTSSRTPFGWQLPGTPSTPASGIDGATFVTINPISGSYLAMENPFGSITVFLTAP